MNENPHTLLMQNPMSIHMAMIALNIRIVMFQGPFLSYLDSSCKGFLTQVSGHTKLRKLEIKIASLYMISTLCYIKLLFLS